MRAIKRILVILIILLFPALVILDITMDIPFPVFAGCITLLFLALFLVGRLFEHPREKLPSETPLTIVVSSGELLVTDDFEFKRFERIPVPNGQLEVTADLSANNERIESIRIVPKDSVFPGEVRDFSLSVDYGLIFIADAGTADDQRLIKCVQDFAGQELATPVFEELSLDGLCFGVAIELGHGNGVYEFHLRPEALTGRVPEE